MSFELITFIIFIAAIALLIINDRKKVKVEGIIFIRRTSRGRKSIGNIAKRHPKFWDAFSKAGVAIAIPAMLLGSLMIISFSFAILSGQDAGAKFVLPGPVAAPLDMPAVFIVPWWLWVIGVMSVMIPHELMHGIVCRLEKIRIKSVGWMLLLFIPGAFVEPDEKQLKRAGRSTKLRVYAAGSFANIVVGLSVIAVLLVIGMLFTPAGISGTIAPGSPANASGIPGIITAVDGVPVKSIDELKSVMSRYNAGDTVQITTANGYVVPAFKPSMDFFVPKQRVVVGRQETRSLTLGEHPERSGPYIGIEAASQAFAFPGDIKMYFTISLVLFWIFIFSVGIGIINLLPIKPLDGGLLFEELVSGSRLQKGLVRAVSGIMLLLLLFNIFGPIFV